jgi:hypothetical protein
MAALGVLGSATVEPLSAVSAALVLETSNWEAVQGHAQNQAAMTNRTPRIMQLLLFAELQRHRGVRQRSSFSGGCLLIGCFSGMMRGSVCQEKEK